MTAAVIAVMEVSSPAAMVALGASAAVAAAAGKAALCCCITQLFSCTDMHWMLSVYSTLSFC